MLFPFRRKQTTARGKSASIPAGLRVYAIGDVHGRLDLLDRIHSRIESHAEARPAGEHLLIYLGDYVDRGPQSAGVVDRLANGALRGWPRITLRGNHEEMLLQFLADPTAGANWRQLGGLETLLSYRVPVSDVLKADGYPGLSAALAEMMPALHREFLQGLLLSERVGDYFFCHAGIRPGIALDQQSGRDLMWIREEFLSSRVDHGVVVVHGHTPVEQAEQHANRINIDTGAYATNHLTCLVLEGENREILST